MVRQTVRPEAPLDICMSSFNRLYSDRFSHTDEYYKDVIIKGVTHRNFQIIRDNCIQNFHLERYIFGYTVGNFVLRRRSCVTVKRDIRPYI